MPDEFSPVYGSSNVDGIKYDPETRECRVRFRGGSTYVYYDVDQGEYDQFFHAPSKGRFVNQILRRSHRYQREHD